MWVDHLKKMCRMPWILAYDLKVRFLFATNLCLGCNFIVFWSAFDIWHVGRSHKEDVLRAMDSGYDLEL